MTNDDEALISRINKSDIKQFRTTMAHRLKTVSEGRSYDVHVEEDERSQSLSVERCQKDFNSICTNFYG